MSRRFDTELGDGAGFKLFVAERVEAIAWDVERIADCMERLADAAEDDRPSPADSSDPTADLEKLELLDALNHAIHETEWLRESAPQIYLRSMKLLVDRCEDLEELEEMLEAVEGDRR